MYICCFKNIKTKYSTMKINLYNSLSKKIENFIPINSDEVRIYSCGPTVYSYAHIGNMRAFLFADLLQRILRTVGNFNVKWVINITNIDDKTIRDSKIGSNEWNENIGKQTGEPIQDLLLLTKFYENEFIVDIEKLGIERSHFFAMPKATDYISEMQELIKIIMQKGLAYAAGGSIYFNVAEYRKTDVYGKLFKIDFDNFKAGLRVDTDQYEREQVSDFVLWKEKKEDEPFWDFEIDGKNYTGRPGWHIECSAMEKKLLGLPFDIHTGGIDLKFPHHEDEITQSKAGYGIEPTNFWCHNEFLEVEGTKMSKSLGNFFTLRQLEEKGIEPIDVRYAMFSVHYRTKYNFTFAGISAARKARLRIQDYIYSIFDLLGTNEELKKSEIKSAKIKELKNAIELELANDLHTPKALAHLFSFVNSNNSSALDESEKQDFLSLIYDLNNIFRTWNFEKKEAETKIEIPKNIIDIAEQRLQAKQAKNFTEADRLRNEIISLGYQIVDTKEGYEITKI